MEQVGLDFVAQNSRKVFTVGEITAAVRSLLEGEFFDIRVEGEISNTNKASSGHYYFTLKDEHAQIRCVCFRQNAVYLDPKPADGLKVLVRGRVGVYEIRGEYQLYVESLEPKGLGALQLAFEQLKKKLTAEGLFEEDRKRPLPFFPRRIGVVTSPTGAVVADIVRVIERRFFGISISLYPVRVQGEGSTGDIVRALNYFSEFKSVDVVIVGRGGGSLEDLWSFNEEAVARAIVRSSVPVVSAVGHQTDFTIADFVADVRSPTPSAAAEMVIRPKADFEEMVRGGSYRLEQTLRFKIAQWYRRMNQNGFERTKGLLRSQLSEYWQRCDEQSFHLRQALTEQLRSADQSLHIVKNSLISRDIRVSIVRSRSKFETLHRCLEPTLRRHLKKLVALLNSLDRQLENLSPLGILKRGYAIVHDQNGAVVLESRQTVVGDSLQIRLHRGKLRVRVDERNPH